MNEDQELVTSVLTDFQIKDYKQANKIADGFLQKEHKTHLCDKICIIGWERDELRRKVEKLEKESIQTAISLLQKSIEEQR